jgi:curved DNA-binding protein CbpA
MAAQREWYEKDYYKVLGVAEDAIAKDITKAYRKLARELHPDANPGNSKAEERFKEVTAAYDVLGDDAKRKEYDEVRRLGPMGGGMFGGGGGQGGTGTTFNMGTEGFNDLLGGLFNAAKICVRAFRSTSKRRRKVFSPRCTSRPTPRARRVVAAAPHRGQRPRCAVYATAAGSLTRTKDFSRSRRRAFPAAAVVWSSSRPALHVAAPVSSADPARSKPVSPRVSPMARPFG